MLFDVLVADDHHAFRSVARNVVAAAPGFRLVGEAASGELAIDLAKDLRPALVLMDIHMPGIGGIEASRRIVADAPGTVVVLLSTYDADAIPADADRCGAECYVRKDAFSPGLLADLLARRAFRRWTPP